MQPVIKVAIVDDHPLVIAGMEKALTGFKQFSLTGTYQGGAALLEGLAINQPDVLILDIQMPGISGEELAKIIHKNYPAIRILVLTGFDTLFYVRNMLQNGCMGYLLKNTDQRILIEAIETVHRGEQFIEAGLKGELVDEALKLKKSTSSITPQLTTREKDVLKLIVDEYTSPEIADKLFLGQRTVEKYRLQLLQKLQVKNTAGLVKAALKLDLLGDYSS